MVPATKVVPYSDFTGENLTGMGKFQVTQIEKHRRRSLGWVLATLLGHPHMTQHCPNGKGASSITPALAVFVSWVCVLSLCGRAEADTSVTTADGGSVQTQLSRDIVLNKESSLRREWVVVHDDGMAVDIVGTPGVTTAYKSREYRGDYRYSADYSIVVREPVVAVEVRFITFDVWGSRTGALSATDIRDFAPGRYELNAIWNLFSENEAAEHYASVGYVALVRTETGEIQHADTEAVTEVAQQYMSDFTSDLLDEDPPEKQRRELRLSTAFTGPWTPADGRAHTHSHQPFADPLGRLAAFGQPRLSYSKVFLMVSTRART